MPNRLAAERSPYLLQHADNPVEWYPWGPEAFTQARELNKPILLSIGYSACHWCHVMAQESFQDAATAALMNELFINIKVDREERPDLDQIYQVAYQLLSERPHGGWPLTMFLAPDGVPFLGGTYFPSTQRYGLPCFKDMLQYVAEAYRKEQDGIVAQNGRVLAGLAATLPKPPLADEAWSDAPVRAAANQLDANFDNRHGGFGSAPKFPHAPDLWLLMRLYARDGSPRYRSIVLTSLRGMAQGGLFDHLGGGFFRYATDAEWNIPHFEKMLNDNGLLLRLYAEAFALTGEAAYQHLVERTANWLLQDMQAPSGGFYGSRPADTGGEEGKHYLWTPDELKACLNDEEYAVAARHFGLHRGANFATTHWHLYAAEPAWQVATHLKFSNEACEALLESARAKLLARRQARHPLGRDEKIVTSWNALAIEGLARAAGVCNRRDWREGARRALDFVRKNLWTQGRLLATAKGQTGYGKGFLDDHALMLSAVLEMLQVDFRTADLQWAKELGNALLNHFEDRADGGFFFTAHDHEKLIHRPKPGLDHALPGGNGVAAITLQRLGTLTGDKRYLDAAARTVKLFYPALTDNPGGFASLFVALLEQLTPPHTVVLRGPDADTCTWRTQLNRQFAPNLITLCVGSQRGALPPSLDKPLTNQPQAWVCEGAHCLPALNEWSALEAALGLPLGLQ